MFVIDHHILYGFALIHENRMNAVEELFRSLITLCCFEIKHQMLKRPFVSMFFVILLSVLLNRDVCEVDVHIIYIRIIRGCVLHIAKPCEALCVEIYLKWPVICDKDV